MKITLVILSLFICLGSTKAQGVETYYLPVPISNHDTIN